MSTARERQRTLAARDDEDDLLLVKRGLALEVEDLRRVCRGAASAGHAVTPRLLLYARDAPPLTQAVVEEVVEEHLRQLRRVREQVVEKRRGELREGRVVGREDREGVALLRRALHEEAADRVGRRQRCAGSSGRPRTWSADTRLAVEIAVTSVERLGVACASAMMSCFGSAKLAGTTAGGRGRR